LTAVVGSSTPSAAETETLHVSTAGSDGNSGSAASPFRTVQRAVDAASPGTTVLVHAGTYQGVVTLRGSGTADRPKTLASAGDGRVVLTASHAPEPCNDHQPAFSRTVMMPAGVDHWTVRGFTIDGGINLFGKDSYSAYRYLDERVRSGRWQERRAIPGRGERDSVAARNAVAYVSARTGGRLDPADGIKILDNVITGRGINATLARYGHIEGNEIRDIDCGTGPGIWVITLSDGWSIRDNFVHHVAPSTHKHYMQEGSGSTCPPPTTWWSTTSSRTFPATGGRTTPTSTPAGTPSVTTSRVAWAWGSTTRRAAGATSGRTTGREPPGLRVRHPAGRRRT
jgi:hypothetical protein